MDGDYHPQASAAASAMLNFPNDQQAHMYNTAAVAVFLKLGLSGIDHNIVLCSTLARFSNSLCSSTTCSTARWLANTNINCPIFPRLLQKSLPPGHAKPSAAKTAALLTLTLDQVRSLLSFTVHSSCMFLCSLVERTRQSYHWRSHCARNARLKREQSTLRRPDRLF